MDTSKRSHEAPTTFSVVSCNGVLMSEVQEPITMLRLTATRLFAAFIRAKWQTRLRRNEYLRLWDCGDGGISRNAVSILCLSIDWLAILTAAKTKVFLFLLEIRICMVTCTMEFSLSSVTNSLLGGYWRYSERIETAVLPQNLFIWQQFHTQLMAVWIISNPRVS